MSKQEVFFWGFGASIALEVVTVYQLYLSHTRIPTRYKRLGFLVIRFVLAFIAGGVSLAFEADTPLLAASIGIAAPLIIQRLSSDIPKDLI